MDLISGIVGRNLATVEKMLGQAQKQNLIIDSKGSKWVEAYFGNENITVIFIQGIADWIKVENVDTKSIESFIETLGLRLGKPSFVKHQEVVRYYNIYGLKEIAFFKDETDRINSIYIKAFTA